MLFDGINTSSIRFLCGDVREIEVLQQGLENADIVVNASGMPSDWGVRQDIWDINVNAPEAMVALLKSGNVKTHFIQLSTATVYGFGEKTKTEEGPLIKSDRFYTASKVDMHARLQEEIKEVNSFPITIVAPSIVWGEGDQIYVPAITRLLREKKLPFIGNISPVDFIHIDDLVSAILLCFFNKASYNQEFIISGSNPFTFNRYIEKIAEFSGLAPPTVTMPKPAYFFLAGLCEYLAVFVNYFVPDYRPPITRLAVRIASETSGFSCEKAKSILGFTPEIEFDTGMDRLKEYVKRCSGF